eukprot:7859158-Alexandrium_andersonii.AAC.1
MPSGNPPAAASSPQPFMTSSSRPHTSHSGRRVLSSEASQQRFGKAQRFWNSRWSTGCSGA